MTTADIVVERGARRIEAATTDIAAMLRSVPINNEVKR